MSRARLLPRAARDLDEIVDWIRSDNPHAARGFANDLHRVVRNLARHPLMGRARPEVAENLRSFPFGRYIVFYLPAEHGIDVVRILHGARDLAAVLRATGTPQPED